MMRFTEFSNPEADILDQPEFSNDSLTLAKDHARQAAGRWLSPGPAVSFSGVQELLLGIEVWLGGAYQADAAQTGVEH